MSTVETKHVFRLEDYLGPGIKKITDLQDKLDGKLKAFGPSATSGYGRATAAAEKFRLKNMEAINQVSNQIPQIGNVLGLLTNPYALATVATLALGAAYVKSLGMAKDWEKGMAKINLTAQETGPELNKLSDKVLNVAIRNKVPLAEVPEAFEKIISAGLDTKLAFESLEPTLKAAKAGFTDVATTADAGVSLMKSGNLQDITDSYDLLFATMVEGKAQFKDIATYLPKLAPVALNYGLALDEVAGSYAYFTAQGQTAEKAANLLENVFKVLGDPEKAEAFKNIGVSFFDSAGKMRPLLDISKELETSLQGLTDQAKSEKLATLGLDSQASAGFAGLAQNITGLEKALNATEAAAGNLDKAVINTKESGDGWAITMNILQAGMIKFGQTGLPIFEAIGNKVAELLHWTIDLWNENIILRDIFSVIGTIAGIAFDVVFSSVSRVWNIVKGLVDALGWVADKVGLSGDGFTKIYETVRPYLVWMSEMFLKIYNIAYKLFTLDLKGAVQDVMNFELPDINVIKNEQNKEINGTDPSPTSNTPSPTKTLPPTPKQTPVSQVAGDGSGQGAGGTSGNNIQINFNDALVKNYFASAAGLNIAEFERTMKEIVARILRDAQAAV